MSEDYNAEDDFAKSLDEGYRAIRERKAAGGPGWEPRPPMLNRPTLPAIPDPGAPLSANDVLRIEAVTIEALPFIDDIAGADDWRRKAKGIEAYLRSPELQRPILGAQRHIEARIGQLLGPAEVGSHHSVMTEGASLVDKDDRAAFRLLARALNGECELVASEWRKSRRALVALIRQKLELAPEAPELPAGKFACIVADPPWRQDTGPDVFNGSGERGHDHLAYEQMSIEEISALRDRNGRTVQDCMADDAHLYLWTINKYVEQSYDIARAWGFKPSTLLTWCKKPRGIGLGDTFKLTTEFVLFCRRGSLQALRTIPTTWFEWPRGRHSQKPDAFFEMVEAVTPGQGRRLELFSRKKRPDWLCWGDEVNGE